jgi:hypothetical protein
MHFHVNFREPAGKQYKHHLPIAANYRQGLNGSCSENISTYRESRLNVQFLRDNTTVTWRPGPYNIIYITHALQSATGGQLSDHHSVGDHINMTLDDVRRWTPW